MERRAGQQGDRLDLPLVMREQACHVLSVRYHLELKTVAGGAGVRVDAEKRMSDRARAAFSAITLK